jgi:hypothetical protein
MTAQNAYPLRIEEKLTELESGPFKVGDRRLTVNLKKKGGGGGAGCGSRKGVRNGQP